MGSGKVPTLCGVPFKGLKRADVVRVFDTFTPVFTVNAEFLYYACTIREFYHVLQKGVNTVDGVWVLRALKLKYPNLEVEHIPGSRVVYDFFELANKENLRVFLLGASPESNAKAVQRLRKEYPNAVFDGYAPDFVRYPFRDTDNVIAEIIHRVREFSPDFVFVAFGPPRQELFIDYLRPVFEDVGVSVAMGVGGTIDMISGFKRLAPKLVSEAGFEWAYRLFREGRWSKLLRSVVGIYCAFLEALCTRMEDILIL